MRTCLYFFAALLASIGTSSAHQGHSGLFTNDTVTLKTLLSDTPNMRSAVFKITKDTVLKLYYMKPPLTTKRKKYPAVVWIHGGGWAGGDAKTFFAHAKYFASRGAIGVSIEYRLVKFNGSSVEDCIKDCRSAIRYLREHAEELNIDPEKIVVMGDSAGGHLAACLGTMEGLFDEESDNKKTSPMANAMVLYNPCIDMTVYPLMKNILKDKIQFTEKLDSASIEPVYWEKARKVSPIEYVRSHQPPSLLLHGLDDKVIPSEQSVRFRDAMTKAGNNSQVILLPETRHAFVVPKYTAPEAKVVAAIVEGDKFLVGLGWLSGQPTLRVSSEPAWNGKSKK